MWNRTRLCTLIAQQPPVFPRRLRPRQAHPSRTRPRTQSEQATTHAQAQRVRAVTGETRRRPPAPATTPRSTGRHSASGQTQAAPPVSQTAPTVAPPTPHSSQPRTPTPFTSAGYRPIAPCRREARVGGPARGRAPGRLGRRLAVMEPAGRMTADRTGPCAADPAGGLQPIRTPAPLTRTRVSPARSVTVSSPGRPRSSPWCNVRTASSATRPNSRA